MFDPTLFGWNQFLFYQYLVSNLEVHQPGTANNLEVASGASNRGGPRAGGQPFSQLGPEFETSWWPSVQRIDCRSQFKCDDLQVMTQTVAIWITISYNHVESHNITYIYISIDLHSRLVFSFANTKTMEPLPEQTTPRPSGQRVGTGGLPDGPALSQHLSAPRGGGGRTGREFLKGRCFGAKMSRVEGSSKVVVVFFFLKPDLDLIWVFGIFGYIYHLIGGFVHVNFHFVHPFFGKMLTLIFPGKTSHQPVKDFLVDGFFFSWTYEFINLQHVPKNQRLYTHLRGLYASVCNGMGRYG